MEIFDEEKIRNILYAFKIDLIVWKSDIDDDIYVNRIVV